MKFSLASVFAVLATSSIKAANGFSLVNPTATSCGAGTSSTALFDSRRRQKIASRTQWIEARGMATTEASKAGGSAAAAAAAGLFKNDGGLEYVKLVHPSTGASSEVYIYGGCVTSYVDGDGTEFIAVRPDAKMDGSKPVSFFPCGVVSVVPMNKETKLKLSHNCLAFSALYRSVEG